MAKVLELRERLRGFFGRNDIYIRPAIRFVVALVTFFCVNSQIGYMKKLNTPTIAIVLALICTFLPVNAIAIIAVLLILIHLYALSLEVCVVGLLLFLLMFFVYYKFTTKNGYTTILTTILCFFKVPHVMPTVVGLRKEPYSVFSMFCGMVVYYFLRAVKENEASLNIAEETAMSKIAMVLQAIVKNEEFYILATAFAVTTIFVYIIRKQSVKHAWTLAISIGNVINLTILIMGNYIIGNMEGLVWILLGTLLAIVVGLVMEFFLFHLDYSRTEHVQFEDDEYYYYVKAVPKVFVSSVDKKVKQINSRREADVEKQEGELELDIDTLFIDNIREERKEEKKPEVRKPEPKKPEVKKPEVRKPEPKKPQAKEIVKPEVKKPEVKKPEVRKPEPKKPEVKKSEVRKAEPKKLEVKETVKPEVKKPEVRKPEPKKPQAKETAKTEEKKPVNNNIKKPTNNNNKKQTGNTASKRNKKRNKNRNKKK